MSDVQFNCPTCAQSLEASPDMAGQQIYCPSCKSTIQVPFSPHTSYITPRQFSGTPKRPTHFTIKPNPTTKSPFRFLLIVPILVLLLLFFLMFLSYLGRTAPSSASHLSDSQQEQVFIDRFGSTGMFTDIKARNDTLTLTVSYAWHEGHYQRRLQTAQGLQKQWASIHDPQHPDHAYIDIVDQMGNKVGGSKTFGSQIWVKEYSP